MERPFGPSSCGKFHLFLGCLGRHISTSSGFSSDSPAGSKGTADQQHSFRANRSLPPTPPCRKCPFAVFPESRRRRKQKINFKKGPNSFSGEMGISLQCCRNLAIAETEIRLSSPMELSKGRRAQEMKKAFFLLAGLLLYLSRESALKSLLLHRRMGTVISPTADEAGGALDEEPRTFPWLRYLFLGAVTAAKEKKKTPLGVRSQGGGGSKCNT